MTRVDGRGLSQLRPVRITRDYNKYAEGSVLVEIGDTRVICTASVEEKLPYFRKLEGTGGWITAEYGMLPRATGVRSLREAARGRMTGRTYEIQRLIGRCLRGVVDLAALGERTVTLDCDVIQADGGTRTASITGAFVALAIAMDGLMERGAVSRMPIKDFLAAVSVGLLSDSAMLDLCYSEDSAADVDMNIIMTGQGKYVEIQGAGEEASFTREQMDRMLSLAETGITQLIDLQKEALGRIGLKIGG